jgi:hypothetical protein
VWFSSARGKEQSRRVRLPFSKIRSQLIAENLWNGNRPNGRLALGCLEPSVPRALRDGDCLAVEVQPSGPVAVGAGGAYSFTVLLQASRLGSDLDGRFYTITVSASNNAGKTGSQAGAVIVPHDQGH